MSPKTPLPRERDMSERFGNTSGNQDRDGNRLSIVDMLEEETLGWDIS